MPSPLRRYVPQLIQTGEDEQTKQPYYVLEYLPCTPLNEIFVHGRNPVFFWKRIFALMSEFLTVARKCQPADSDLQRIQDDSIALYGEKTYQRLQQFSREQGLDLDATVFYDGVQLPSLNAIASDCIQRTTHLPTIPAVLHGDFCLSNVLFDSRAAQIKVIDPRGISNGGSAMFSGDQKYDIAKLSHSIIGLYDYIIAGRYQIIAPKTQNSRIDFILDERIRSIQQQFNDTAWHNDLRTVEILPLTVLLFLSMLPLHSDRTDRQQAMLLNALRLYSTLSA